jgi:VWFA-related protein
MRIPTALAAALAAGAALPAQQPAQPSFRSGVELVTIDVVATSSDGRPVHGLTQDDFELFEDGERQPIRTFQFLNMAALPEHDLPPPGVITNVVEPGGLFAVVLDEIGIQVDDVQAMRRVAARFFTDTLLPDDHVAVVRSGVESGFFLTADRTLALEAIARSTGRRERTLGVTEPGAADAELVESPVTIETFGTAENGRNSFRVLAGVIERLRHIPARRKAILWFSRGGDLPPNYIDSLLLGRPVGRDDEVFSRLIRLAREANVAVYTVDPRGLRTLAAELTRDLEPFDLGPLRDLADATGGRAVLNNDLNGALDRIAAENRAYYLIGYEPPAAANRTRAHTLRVTTRAPGVALLHRTVFVPAEASRSPAPPLLASPLPISDLPIQLAPASVALDRRKRGILLPFEIGGGLADGTEVEYSALALDASGRTVARTGGKVRVAGGRAVGDAGMAVQAQTYAVRFAAHTANGARTGLAFATVRVPEGRSTPPECGGIVFEQPGRRGALRQYDRAAPLTISTMVSAEKLTGQLTFGIGAAAGIPERIWPVAPGTPLANGLWRVVLTLKPPLPAGDFDVQLMQDDLLMHDNCLAQFTLR